VILAGTGHRPNKLGGYGDEIYYKLIRLAEAALRTCTPEKVISGMALGWDQALAQTAVNLGVPFVAAVPYVGQDGVWPIRARDRYANILGKAAEKVIVSPGNFSALKMQKRNEWMVDNGTHVLALWDGTPGGTGNCIKYAEKVGKPIINLWKEWLS